MADDIVREVGHVDILIANLAYPHTYLPVHEKTDADLEYAMQRIMYPLHRLTRAVLPQMLRRKRGKIVVVGSATSLRGRKGVSRFTARPGRTARLHEERRDGGCAVRQRECHRANLC